MTDSPNDLERMLARWKPAQPTASLDSRIEQALQRQTAEPERRSLSDRLLLATMSAGLIAACVIVTLLTTEALNAPKSTPTANRADGPTIMNTQHLLAQLTKDMQ